MAALGTLTVQVAEEARVRGSSLTGTSHLLGTIMGYVGYMDLINLWS